MNNLSPIEWIGLVAALLTIAGVAYAAYKKIRANVESAVRRAVNDTILPPVRLALEEILYIKPSEPGLLGINLNILLWGHVIPGMRDLVRDAHDFRPTAVFGINRGGALVGGYIAKKLDRELHLVRVDVEAGAGDQVKSLENVDTLDTHKIYLVDDSYRSGRHMTAAYHYLQNQHPDAEIRTAVLLRIESSSIGIERGRPSVKVHHEAFVSHNATIKIEWDPQGPL